MANNTSIHFIHYYGSTINYINHMCTCTATLNKSMGNMLFLVPTSVWYGLCWSLVGSFRVNAAVLCGLTVLGDFRGSLSANFTAGRAKAFWAPLENWETFTEGEGLGPESHSFHHLLSCLKGLTAWNASVDAQCLLLGKLIKGGETYTYTA